MANDGDDDRDGDTDDWDWGEVDDAGPARLPRNGNSMSTVFSLRLGHAEYRELRTYAESRQVGTTVLARAMIRSCLHGRDDVAIDLALASLQDSILRLRLAGDQ